MQRFEIWVTKQPVRSYNGRKFPSYALKYVSDNVAQITVLWNGLNIGNGYWAKLVQGLRTIAVKR